MLQDLATSPVTQFTRREQHVASAEVHRNLSHRSAIRDDPLGHQLSGLDRTYRSPVPQDLLNVRIGHISFDEEHKNRYPMYFPANVLWFITHTPEVVTFMKDNDIRLVPTMMNESSSPVPRCFWGTEQRNRIASVGLHAQDSSWTLGIQELPRRWKGQTTCTLYVLSHGQCPADQRIQRWKQLKVCLLRHARTRIPDMDDSRRNS